MSRDEATGGLQKVHVQKDIPFHEEGCTICDSAPRGVTLAPHTHTAKEYRGLGEAETDKPFHGEGCAICDSAPQGRMVGDHAHTAKERSTLARPYYATEIKEDEAQDIPSSRVGDQIFTDAEKRVRAAQISDSIKFRDQMENARVEMENAHKEKVSRDAKQKTDIENLLAEIHAMFKELMTLQRRRFQLRQKIFSFQFAPETLNEDSTFNLESIAAHRLRLLKEEMGED